MSSWQIPPKCVLRRGGKWESDFTFECLFTCLIAMILGKLSYLGVYSLVNESLLWEETMADKTWCLSEAASGQVEQGWGQTEVRTVQ